MPGFDLRDIHFANLREGIAFQAGKNFIRVAFRPEPEAAGVP